MKKGFKSIYVWLPLVVAFSVVLGLWFGARYMGGVFGQGDRGSSRAKLDAILSYIEQEYVDEVNIDSLLEMSFSEILSQLDPHTSYIPAADLQAFNEDIEGSFSGIGISFNMLSDTITVIDVISGGPSEKVGVMPGDRIVTINDTIVADQNWSQERVIKTLRGDKGTEVKLGIKRDSSPSLLDFTVTRGDIPVTSIDACYMIDENIGYLKINKFAKETASEFLNSMVQLKNQGAEKYILDLRDNGGGVMDAAIFMANEFLHRDDVIVSTKGRNEQMNTSSVANGTGAFQEDDLVVLINEFSASASEIVAGAVQDNDRGLIVGRRSFGKGLVQRVIELPDYSALRLTVARYYTPSGRCIQKTYTNGNTSGYLNEIVERFNHGESFSADSMKIDRSDIFHTVHGREVYGGGGIVPDLYVASDSSGINDYYINVFNAAIPQKFAFHYADTNRKRLQYAMSVDELMRMLPSDEVLLQEFANYAKNEAGILPRWYYINKSADLIVSQLKALIAHNMMGTQAFYEVNNRKDIMVQEALKALNSGKAHYPVTTIDKTSK